MRIGFAVVVLVAACGHKRTPAEECAEITRKVRPVIAKMGTDAGKPMSDAQLDEFSKGFCESGAAGEDEKKFKACVLAASSDADTAACMKPLFEDYANASQKNATEIEAKRKEFEKQRDDLEKQRELQEAPFRAMADAAVLDAAPKIPPVDLATLTAWPIPAGTKASGTKIDIYAADADADSVLGLVWDRRTSLLVVANDKQITGKLEGTSMAEARAAVAAAADIKPVAVTFKGKGARVDLSFFDAPQRDLMPLFADVLKLNIVVSAKDLPDVDLVAQRAPADGVLDAIIALDGLTTKRFGNVLYVLPKQQMFPTLPREVPNVLVDLDVKNGTAAEAFAALRAVVPGLGDGACTGYPFDLRLRKVRLDEALRTILVTSTGTLLENTTGGCEIATGTRLPSDAAITVLATSGTTTSAVVRANTTSTLVEKVAIVTTDLGITTVKIGDKEMRYSAYDMTDIPHDAEQWFAALVRTTAVMRENGNWKGLLENMKGQTVSFDPQDRLNTFMFSGAIPTLSEEGLEATAPRPLSIPLVRK